MALATSSSSIFPYSVVQAWNMDLPNMRQLQSAHKRVQEGIEYASTVLRVVWKLHGVREHDMGSCLGETKLTFLAVKDSCGEFGNTLVLRMQAKGGHFCVAWNPNLKVQ
eukprot:6474515-Amphidinium_carterae.1